jgi:hypothetical protein
MLGLIVGEVARVPTPQMAIVSVPISPGQHCAKVAILRYPLKLHGWS